MSFTWKLKVKSTLNDFLEDNFTAAAVVLNKSSADGHTHTVLLFIYVSLPVLYLLQLPKYMDWIRLKKADIDFSPYIIQLLTKSLSWPSEVNCTHQVDTTEDAWISNKSIIPQWNSKSQDMMKEWDEGEGVASNFFNCLNVLLSINRANNCDVTLTITSLRHFLIDNWHFQLWL